MDSVQSEKDILHNELANMESLETNRPRIMRTPYFTLRAYLSSIFLCIALLPTAVFALTPIARYDVVPNQRIAYGTTFKFGVVAFSKADIQSVAFSISGQGYSGGVKTATSMTHNDRTDVYEYWVPISSSEFTSNGTFTVTALVTGRDGDTRNLGALTLNVDATNALAQTAAWVSPSGNNSTGEINNKSMPFSTIAGAIVKIQAANSGTADGAIVYLQEGTYSATYDNTTRTTDEWLTITKDPDASESAVIISSVGTELDTHLVRLKDVTLQNSTGYTFPNGTADYVWFDNCRIIGSGRQSSQSNPIQNRTWSSYWTNNYIYNLDLAIHKGILSRGNNISTISDDAHQNTYFVVNDRVDDVDPEPQYPTREPHADVYQMHVIGNPSPENIIVYGVHATNLHYQGLFCRPSSEGTPVKNASNVAFVNNFFEPRAPYRSPGGGVSSLQGIWDHLLLWHNTFANRAFVIYKDTTTQVFSFTNVSMIGNYFYEFQDASSRGVDFNIGNTKGNESLENHYYYSYADGYGSNTISYSPDTASPASDSVGTLELDLTDTATYVNFGYPINASSVLVGRISTEKVPADTLNVARDLKADVGAIESPLSKSPPSPPLIR